MLTLPKFKSVIVLFLYYSLGVYQLSADPHPLACVRDDAFTFVVIAALIVSQWKHSSTNA